MRAGSRASSSRGLAANGTTTALVFGSHFPAAQEAFFEEAERSGLRIASGLVVSDRNLLPELHVDPDAAYDAGRELAGRWHGRGPAALRRHAALLALLQ